MQEALEMGQIEVWLEGKKLRGGYALIHSELGGKKQKQAIHLTQVTNI